MVCLAGDDWDDDGHDDGCGAFMVRTTGLLPSI